DPPFGNKRTGGMRGYKKSLYEGGIRLPFIAVWPGHIPSDAVDSTSVLSAMDIFPTLADIIGIPMPDRYAFDGESRRAAWFGHPSKRTSPLYWEYGSHGKKSAYHYAKGRDRSPNLAIRQGKWKLLINYDGSNLQLYNLKTDRDESSNVAEIYPDIANRLKEKLIKWRNNLPVWKRLRGDFRMR